MNKSHVLVCIDWFTPGYKAGGPIQSCQSLINAMGDEVQFTLLTRNSDYNESTPYPGIEANKPLAISESLTVTYIASKNLNISNIRRHIRSSEAELLYLNGMFSFYFSILPLFFRGKKKVVVATRGMLAPNALKIKSGRKKSYLVFAKTIGLYTNVTFQATNKDEAEDICRIFPKNNIVVAGNFPVTHEPISQPIHKDKGSIKLISVARISPEKNLLFALEAIATASSTIDFTIFGSVNDAVYWARCQHIIRHLPSHIRVNFRGPIEPQKIPFEMSQHHALLMPTLGENFGHIIYEALACSCPVILSDKTMWKNLQKKKAGWDLPLENITNFTNTIDLAAAMDAPEFEEWRKGARDFAKNFLDTKAIKEDYRKLFLV